MSSIVRDPEDSTTSVASPVVDAEPANPTEQTVVMDGPLSRIYTEALNLVYAQHEPATEGSAGVDVPIVSALAVMADQEEDHQAEKYVYATNAGELEAEGTVEPFEKLRVALDTQSYKTRVLVIEDLETVTPRTGRLETFARQNGFKVYFNRHKALEALIPR